jgi:hypothetical protein
MSEFGETRQERRERKLAARRERMQKHGAGLAQAYANAVLKRARAMRPKRAAPDADTGARGQTNAERTER